MGETQGGISHLSVSCFGCLAPSKLFSCLSYVNALVN